ncbi:MAG TPA: hypothetical protein VJL08_00870 [Dehalococcoidia bacterium]|nr:hypothetical protein [Dehalococcoidia bacterium]
MRRKALIRAGLIILFLMFAVLPAGSARQANTVSELAQPYSFGIAGWEADYLLRFGPARSDGLRVALGQQVSQILVEQGLTTSLGPFNFLFPPLRFELTELPYLLVVSPRDTIRLSQTVLLNPSLSDAQVVQLETKMEKLGLSAVIERVGGVALYPSMVPEGGTIESTMSTIAHEWFHQYLFFRPLGRAYWSSYDMTTINETAANMVGQDIGEIAYRRFYGGGETDSPPQPIANATPPSGFDFNKEMRSIRLNVDSLLQRREVEEAEDYMEGRRLYLAEHGYFIRKLNQAYFAFHGTYADAPTSVSPLRDKLLELRRLSDSVGEFARLMAGISTPQELDRLLQSR